MRPLGLATIGVMVLIIAEIVVFVLVADAIGLGWALLLALATMVLGAYLLKKEGVRGWHRFRSAVAEGRPPGREAGDGLVGLGGALLLLAPGFLTAAAGLLLFLPPVRALGRAQVRRWAESRISPAAAGGFFGPRVVRAERGEPSPAGEPVRTPQGEVAKGDVVKRGAVEGEIVEGEIVDPRQP